MFVEFKVIAKLSGDTLKFKINEQEGHMNEAWQKAKQQAAEYFGLASPSTGLSVSVEEIEEKVQE